MTAPEFTEDELRELAGFVCGRYDDLMGIVRDPSPRIADRYRDGAAGAARALERMNAKLRPYHDG